MDYFMGLNYKGYNYDLTLKFWHIKTSLENHYYSKGL